MGKQIIPLHIAARSAFVGFHRTRRFLSVRWLARRNSGSFWFARPPSKNSDFGCNRCCKISMSQLT